MYSASADSALCRYAFPDSYRYALPDTCANAHSAANSYCHSRADSHTHSYPTSYPNAHSHGNIHSIADSHPRAHADPYANANKVLVYNSLPTRPDQVPDFAIGSPALATNTLDTNYIIQNGVPASNGKSLFVISGFDHRLYVWKNLPDQSGAHPDIVYSFLYEARGIALWKENLALAGERVIHIWKELPITGKLPDVTFLNEIGGVPLKDLQGVAMDDKHFYLSDSVANKVYVWKGIPSEDSAPAFTLDVEEPYRLSSDGIYLTVAQTFKNTVLVYPVDGLSATTKPVAIGGVGKHNGVPAAGAAGGHFFLVDGGFNRIFIWRNVQDALAGKEADVVLGANWHKYRPEIGRNTLYWPYGFFFDGSYLWVGEVKFSTRILRFSPSP